MLELLSFFRAFSEQKLVIRVHFLGFIGKCGTVRQIETSFESNCRGLYFLVSFV